MALEVPYNRRTLHDSSQRYRNSRPAGRAFASSSASGKPTVPIPRAEIFDQLSKPAPLTNDAAIQIPNVSECAVHLKLLHALYALREKVLHSKPLDEAFDIKPQPRTVWRGYRRNRRQVKLKDSHFTQRRKEKWPIFVKFAVLRFLQWVKEADSDLHEAESTGQEKNIGLPPLDILMVWHSCLLNPKDFQLFCQKNSYEHIREVEFPWEKIHRAISQDDWAFTLFTEEREKLEKPTASRSDSHCANSEGDWVFTMFTEGGEKSQKLNRPESNLEKYLWSESKDKITHNILENWLSTSLSRAAVNVYVKSASEQPLGSEKYFQECLRPAEEKYILEQMTSAVQRQTVFVDKMEGSLWIRSPAVSGTLERAVDRYGKFIKLFKLYPQQMLVPTVDIDLVWHTHQCSASRYQADMESYTGRYINHDDKLGNGVLGDGMEKTTELYRVRFGREYSTCLCWDCEAALSAGERLSKDLGKPVTGMRGHAEHLMSQLLFHKKFEKARWDAKTSFPKWDMDRDGPYWC